MEYEVLAKDKELASMEKLMEVRCRVLQMISLIQSYLMVNFKRKNQIK